METFMLQGAYANHDKCVTAFLFDQLAGIIWKVHAERRDLEGVLALHAHYALLLDYVSHEEPPYTPLPNTLKFRPAQLC